MKWKSTPHSRLQGTGIIDGRGRANPEGPSAGMGRGGFCICPKCGYRQPHQRGVRCQEERCPECNGKMVREGSYHHNKIVEKQGEQKKRKADGRGKAE